jgi:hypothetical protein
MMAIREETGKWKLKTGERRTNKGSAGQRAKSENLIT